MSFLDLGRTILNGAKESLREGLTSGLLNGLGKGSMNGYTGRGVSGDFGMYSYENNYEDNVEKTDSFKKYSSPSKMKLVKNDGEFKVTESETTVNNPLSDNYNLKLPTWGYADFINERAVWQKQLSSIFDEPAWFYFKVFFDFDTGHGLFGGLLNSTIFSNATNSAAKYLYSCGRMYKEEKPMDRINALYKFTSILNHICRKAPWYFKGVNGLDKLSVPVVDEYSKERSIEIELNHDAIDMRLTTLMSLYKYACWDDYNHKEVIPENLRQFNMSIVLFQTPLRYLHTSFITNEKKEFMGIDMGGLLGGYGNSLFGLNKNSNKINYKSISGDNGDVLNRMSFKIYSLYGCEFDMESFAQVIPSSVSNEEPFKMGKNNLKIKYTFCTEHSMNEFYEMMYGTNGFYFNQYGNFQKEKLSNNSNDFNIEIKNDENHSLQLERYQALIDIFKSNGESGSILGLINKPRTYKKAVDATEALMNGLFEDNDLLGDLGTNFLLGMLGSSKNTDAPQGNLYGDYGIGSAYFKDKLEMLKYGVHENTQTPYTYDEHGDPIYAKYRPANHYSAYDWKQTKESITNFNLSSYLKNGTNKLSSNVNDALRKIGHSSMDGLPEISNKVLESAKSFVKQPDKNYDPGNNLEKEYSKYEITPDTNSLKDSNRNVFKK